MKNMKNVTVYGLIFAFLLAGSLRADSASSKEKITFDRYYMVELQDQRCGYARTAIRESAEKITYLNYVHIMLRQFGQDMLMVFKLISHETHDGRLISMDQTLYTNGTEVTKTAHLESDELIITTTLFGKQITERYPVPEGGFVTETAADRLIRPLLNQPGKRLELTMLSLEGGSTPFMPATLEVIGPETISAYGQAVSATKVATTITMDSVEFPSRSWCDEEGILAVRMDVVGMSIYLCASDEDQAKKPAGSADLGFVSRIVPKVPLTDPDKARKAVFRLKLKNPQAPMPDLPQTDMQRILDQGQDYVDLEVTWQDPEKYACVTDHKVPQELAKYLKSTLYLDWRTPAVAAAARQVTSDSDKPWDLALALWKYVDKTIFVKNFEVAFDPASNVLSTHQGDCTEHAVLLAALARARGLPSRLVVGLTQVPGPAGRDAEFGYHAWNEVWIGGTWVSLDAALRQAPVDVGHIALAVSATDSPHPLRGADTQLIQVIGNPDIEVLHQE